jgi:hypothetical protein
VVEKTPALTSLPVYETAWERRLRRTPAGQEQEMWMLSKREIRAAVIIAVLALTGCNVARDTSCKCPKPVAYDEATLAKISQALRALPSENVLHQAMEDYENERDDLRFCQ